MLEEERAEFPTHKKLYRTSDRASCAWLLRKENGVVAAEVVVVVRAG